MWCYRAKYSNDPTIDMKVIRIRKLLGRASFCDKKIKQKWEKTPVYLYRQMIIFFGHCLEPWGLMCRHLLRWQHASVCVGSMLPYSGMLPVVPLLLYLFCLESCLLCLQPCLFCLNSGSRLLFFQPHPLLVHLILSLSQSPQCLLLSCWFPLPATRWRSKWSKLPPCWISRSCDHSESTTWDSLSKVCI